MRYTRFARVIYSLCECDITSFHAVAIYLAMLGVMELSFRDNRIKNGRDAVYTVPLPYFFQKVSLRPCHPERSVSEVELRSSARPSPSRILGGTK